MANGFVNSTDESREEDIKAEEESRASTALLRKKSGAEQKVEEKFRVKIFDLLGLIDED